MQAPMEQGYARWQGELALQRFFPVISGNKYIGMLRERGGLGLIAIVAWEIQSQVATMALLSLLVLASAWVALGVMLTWSLLAAVAYSKARQHGLPDLLKLPAQDAAATARPSLLQQLLGLPVVIGKVWLSGIQPFIYSRTLCRVLHLPNSGRGSRLAKLAVLGVGLTLFGVTANHHMLERAGLSGGTLLRFSMAGAALNVAYRVVFSAFVLSLMTGLVNRLVL